MELSSEEGTTQGCPLSMAMYALNVVPLISECGNVPLEDMAKVIQVWYADDAAAGGRLLALRHFWDKLTS